MILTLPSSRASSRAISRAAGHSNKSSSILSLIMTGQHSTGNPVNMSPRLANSTPISDQPTSSSGGLKLSGLWSWFSLGLFICYQLFHTKEWFQSFGDRFPWHDCPMMIIGTGAFHCPGNGFIMSSNIASSDFWDCRRAWARRRTSADLEMSVETPWLLILVMPAMHYWYPDKIKGYLGYLLKFIHLLLAIP